MLGDVGVIGEAGGGESGAGLCSEVSAGTVFHRNNDAMPEGDFALGKGLSR